MKVKIIINDNITIDEEIQGNFETLKIKTDESIFEFDSPKKATINNKNSDGIEFNSKDLDDLYNDNKFWN